MRKRKIIIASVFIGLVIAGLSIAQTPLGGSLWTYYLQGNSWKWARLDVESPLQIDTTVSPARLKVLLPQSPAIRQTTEKAVVLASDPVPYTKKLVNVPIPESLMVTVNGLVVEAGFDYNLSGQVVTFATSGTPGYPGPESRLQFRYRY
jgi:hypothetical protein